MTFPPNSLFNQEDMELPTPPASEPVKQPTAQIPFEHWHNELSDVLTYSTLDDSVKDVIQGVADEIYSFLRG